MSLLPKQEREYVQQYIKSAWEGFIGAKNRYFFGDRENISEIRQFMTGKISPVRFQKIVTPPELANADDTGAKIDWKLLDIHTKYRRIAIQIVMAMKEELDIEMIDALAMEEKEEFFAEKLADIIVRDKLVKQGVDPAEVGLPEDLPADQKELEMFMEYSFKHIAAIEFSTILKLIKNRNKFDQKIYKKLVEDLYDIGVCVTRDYEEADGNIIAKYVDPEFFFCSYSEENDFSDLDFAGQLFQLTPAEIYRLCLDESEKRGVKDIENLMNGNHPNTREYADKKDALKEDQDLSGSKLKVIYCEFVSGESETYELRITKDGRKVFGKESSGKKNKEFMDAEFDIVYEGYRIAGTEVYFGLRRKEFVLRDPEDVKVAKLTYNVNAPEMNHMAINSVGAQKIPIIEAMQIAWIKLQAAILAARPSGIAYDLTALEAVSFGEGGMSPEENILTYNTKGNLAIRAVDEDGNRHNLPVTELSGGLGQEGQEFMQLIGYYENLLRSITGLNDVVDGSSPNPRTLKSVAQQAAASTNNALKHIHDAAQMNELSLSEHLIMRVQDQAESEEIEFYAPAVGRNSVSFFKLTKDHSMRSLGLYFIHKPTAEEEERFSRALEIAAATPEGSAAQITVAQRAFLEQIDNKKHALMYLGYIVEKNLEEARTRQDRAITSQAEANARAAQQAEAAKQQTAQLEGQIKLGLIDREYQWKMRIAGIETQGRVTGQELNADARDRESKRMNETKTAELEQQRIDQEKKENEGNNK